MTGIYFAVAGRYLKIGCSMDITARLNSIRVENTRVTRCIGYIPVDCSDLSGLIPAESEALSAFQDFYWSKRETHILTPDSEERARRYITGHGGHILDLPFHPRAALGRPPLNDEDKHTSPVLIRMSLAQRAKVTRQAHKAGYPSVAAYFRALAGLGPPQKPS